MNHPIIIPNDNYRANLKEPRLRANNQPKYKKIVRKHNESIKRGDIMAKLQESKGRYWLTIPLEKIKVKGWKKGDQFSLDFNKEGQLVITKI